MKTVIITFLFCLSLSLNAQPKESIKLPEGGKEMAIEEALQLFSLYVTENQEVYNDGRKLEYFDDISYSILDQKNKSIDEWTPQLVLLYADKNVKYSFIEAIKIEVAKAKNNIHYNTGNVEALETINKLLEYNPNNFKSLHFIKSKEEELAEGEIESVFMMTPPPPPPSLVAYIYAVDKTMVEEGLNSFSTYTFVTLKNDKILDSNGEPLDEQNLANLIPNEALLFIRYDKNLLYGDYIKSTVKLDELRKKLKETKQIEFRPFEASSELEAHFKKLTIPFQKQEE